MAKYVWNILLCESLYPGFQVLEAAFRNATHLEIAANARENLWLLNKNGFLHEDELAAIKQASQSIRARGMELTEDTLAAELSFAFWTSLLDSRYDQMWHKIIAGVFPHMPRSTRTRREVSSIMNRVRKLRNAALHHHSIWHWQDLAIQHQQMQLLISYICRASSAMASQIDRFPDGGARSCMAAVQAMPAIMQSNSSTLPST